MLMLIYFVSSLQMKCYMIIKKLTEQALTTVLPKCSNTVIDLVNYKSRLTLRHCSLHLTLVIIIKILATYFNALLDWENDDSKLSPASL
jgi:hypothetical protein